MIVAINFAFRAPSPASAVGTVRWSGALGGGIGVGLGLVEALWIQRTEAVARASERRAPLERERDRLAEFAQVVSHDTTSPLPVVTGYLDGLREDYDDPRLDDVASAHSRLSSIVEDTRDLAWAGQRVGAMEPIDLDEVARRSWQLVARGDAELRGADVGRLDADGESVGQVLENLFANACDHAGDDVIVTVGALDDGPGFFVADDGHGIPPADREAVFEVGHSEDRPGTGLGLPVVRAIAVAHDRTVEVTASADGGARFEFRGVESVD